MIPDVELTSDVAGAVETVPAVNYSEKIIEHHLLSTYGSR